MPEQASFFGGPNLQLGPCNLYWDTVSGGLNLPLGGMDATRFTMQVAKTDLKEAQAGDRPADRSVSSQVYQVSGGLSRPTIDRIENVIQGIEVERDTSGEVIRLSGSLITGQRDSSIWRQMTLVRLEDGLETWSEPSKIVDCWRVAPMNDSVELVYDATTQRFFGTLFEMYPSELHLDHKGRPTFFKTRSMI